MVERFLSTLNVMRSMIMVMFSISSSSVFSLICSEMALISSVMLIRRFSQYSSRILTRVRPKSKWASSHFRCNAEFTTGTCGVRLILKDFNGTDLNPSHFFR